MFFTKDYLRKLRSEREIQLKEIKRTRWAFYLQYSSLREVFYVGFLVKVTVFAQSILRASIVILWAFELKYFYVGFLFTVRLFTRSILRGLSN